MARKKSALEKKPYLIVLLVLLIGIGVVLIPFAFAAILFFLFPDADGYLLMEFAFRFFVSIAAGLIPLFFFVRVSIKKNEKIKIAKLLKKNILIILGTIIIVMLLACNGPYRDIKMGPQEVAMTDAVVKETRYNKSHNTYLEGYIDGKKVSLRVTRDARDRLKRNDKFKVITIEYYKNIKQVFDIGISLKYEDDE